MNYKYWALRRVGWEDSRPEDKTVEYKCVTCRTWHPIDDIAFENGSQYCRSCMLIMDSQGMKPWGSGLNPKENK